SPRRLTGRVRVRHVVDPDHPRLEAIGDTRRECAVPRPDARAEPERARVGEPHHLFLAVEELDRDDRPEDLLAAESLARARDDGRLVEPARQRDVGPAATGDDTIAGSRDELLD